MRTSIGRHLTVPVWRAAWGRIKCPVVREFLALFALPMPDKDERDLASLLLHLQAERLTRIVEWQRAAFLGDRAVRVFAPIHLEKLGHADHADAIRAIAPLRRPSDFFAMDELFSQRPWEHVSEAARSAANWASALGDATAPARRIQRVWCATAAGQAMQVAESWPEGIEALRRVARIRTPRKGWGES